MTTGVIIVLVIGAIVALVLGIDAIGEDKNTRYYKRRQRKGEYDDNR